MPFELSIGHMDWNGFRKFDPRPTLDSTSCTALLTILIITVDLLPNNKQ